MRHAQVIVYEGEGRLAGLLRARAEAEGWGVREVRHPRTALRLLQRGGALLLHVGRDLERELALLERALRLFPDCPALVAGDAGNPALAALCWDLGARYVLFPPQPRELLPDLVAGFLRPAPTPPAEDR